AFDDLPGKPTKRRIRTNDELHWETQRLDRVRLEHRNSLEMFEKRRTRIPRRLGAGFNDIVAFGRAYGDARRRRNAELRSEVEKIFAQPRKNVFAIVDEIHLVDGRNKIRNSEQ